MTPAETVVAIVCLASLVVFALSLRAIDLLAADNERLRELIAALERKPPTVTVYGADWTPGAPTGPDVIDTDTARRRG